MHDLYDMKTRTRKILNEYTKDEGYPAPSASLTPIFVSLVTRHRISIIMEEIDEMIDRLFVLDARLDEAIAENNLTAVVLIKSRLDEEKGKLKAYERLLDREVGVKVEENGITDEMILRAREYPFEDLLPEQLKRGRCKCPVHTGNNPMSFEVKDNKGRCYSCGWYGDTIDYLMITEGYTFGQAVKRLQ